MNVIHTEAQTDLVDYIDSNAKGLLEVDYSRIEARILAHMQKEPNYAGARYHSVRSILHEAFPAAFPARGQPCQPLRIGVHNDVLNAGLPLTRNDVRYFFRCWCNRPEYLRLIREGANRINLTGQPVDKVTREHAARAHKLLADKRSKRSARHMLNLITAYGPR